MLSKKIIREIDKILDDLRKLSRENTPIIVEGEKDERSLRQLKIKGPIYHISGTQKSALNFLEDLRDYEEVIILTDFDMEGDKLAGFTEKHLPKLGVKAELKMREKLKKYLFKGVKDIEGLNSFLKREKIKKIRYTSRANQKPRNP